MIKRINFNVHPFHFHSETNTPKRENPLQLFFFGKENCVHLIIQLSFFWHDDKILTTISVHIQGYGE